jgi:hypothetical protein
MLPAPKDPNTGEALRDKAVIDWTWAVLARIFAPPTEGGK